MPYRNIFITSPSKLSVINNQLMVTKDEIYSFPLEDISTIMLESRQISLSSSVLSRFAKEGILVYLCDEKHLPCGVVTGYNSHSRKLKILQSQIDLKQPLKKRLWQDIVTSKITNQANVLKLLNLEGYSEIMAVSRKVKLNDEDNMEAVAASRYFKYLFGNGFFRDDDNLINARLNYGYAIVRGMVCRCLVAYGFEPALGIHHKNQLNPFNLADDVMEVFRPVVDLCVYEMDCDDDTAPLSPKDKQILYNLLNCDVIFNKQKHPLSYAVEKTVQTLQASYLENKNKLVSCEIISLKMHEYE